MLIGLITGILAGLLGVGGGIVMVPAMIVLFGIPAVVAKGTSLAVIVPTAVMGTWRNRTKHNTDLRIAAVVGMAGIVYPWRHGVSQVSVGLSETTSNVLFAILLAQRIPHTEYAAAPFHQEAAACCGPGRRRRGHGGMSCSRQVEGASSNDQSGRFLACRSS